MIDIVKRVKLSKLFIEVHIADLHFGAMNPENQYKILKEQFLSVIEEMNKVDIVSINGDIFDHKFMANSDAIMYACYFIDALVRICQAKNATLLIISGTFEHDSDQLKMFYPYCNLDSGVDVRIIEQVQFEYIKGKRILIIPELYGKGEEYYSKFLYNSGLYDACYMHGTFAGTIFGKDEPSLDSPREPIFSMDHFINCLGPIISGHNHTPGCHSVYFYYCGCPYRWKFGEEEDKGFIILLHNIETREHMIHFEPIKSFRYDTVNLDEMLTGDPKRIIEYLDNLQKNGVDHVRVQFTINKDDVISILRNYYRTSSSVKIDTNFKNDKVKEDIKNLDTKYKEYSYLMDKCDPETKLANYMNQKEGHVFMSAQELKEFLQKL